MMTITAQAQLLEQTGNLTTATFTPQVIVITATPENGAGASPPIEEPVASAEILPPASGAPTVTVSVATNCRTGPGRAYPSNYGLPVDVSAEVVGKNTSTNYWIIQIPNGGGTCWLWGQYATVTGDTSGLQNVAIPPTPTPMVTPTFTITPSFTPTKVVLQPPSAPSNLSQTHICSIGAQVPVNIYAFDGTATWQDNSNNEDGFRVYSFDNYLIDTQDRFLGTVGPNVTSFNFSTSSFGKDTTLKVEAFNNAGQSTRVSIFVPGNNCPP